MKMILPIKTFLPAFSAFAGILTTVGVMFSNFWGPGPNAVFPTPLFIQSSVGPVEIYSAKEDLWKKASVGSLLKNATRIKTGNQGQIDLKAGENLYLRIKENSIVEAMPAKKSGQNSDYELRLVEGSLLAYAKKGLQISIPEANQFSLLEKILLPMKLETKRGLFLVQSIPKEKKVWIGMLHGEALVHTNRPWELFRLRDLQKIEAPGNGFSSKKISRISQSDWRLMKEAYQLQPKHTSVEALQIDLFKEAGNLSKFVFDHGTFYDEKTGHAEREFDRTEDGVFLEMSYDVFTPGSTVGTYFKTRNLEITRFKKLKFEARRAGDENYPLSFQIELKTGLKISRVFRVNSLNKEWTAIEFPIKFYSSTPVSEITFVFSNQNVGNFKRGSVQFRKLELEEKAAK